MNIYLVNILLAASVIIVSYLFGAIPTGVIVGKLFYGKDIREYGSKNTGGTNAARVLGKKVGVLVIILDMIKTVLPFFITWAVILYTPLFDYIGAPTSAHGAWYPFANGGQGAAPLYYWSSALICAIGHCWSIFLKFKGGKAVSCFMGVNVLTSWIEFVLAGFTYLGVAKKTKIISISSIVAGIVGSVVAWTVAIIVLTTGWNPHWLTWLITIEEAPFLGLEFAIIDTIVSVLLIARHHSNIQRLRAGTESVSPFAKVDN